MTPDPFDTARLRRDVLHSWEAAPARFREDANAEEDLARGGYRDRLVIELAQNASDAAARAGHPGRLRLSLRDGQLLAANTGVALDAPGVASLSTLRASAKRDTSGEAGPVGRFGIGFAAVLAVSDAPSIAGRAGGARWSLAEASGLATTSAQSHPELAEELDRRAGHRHAVPLLRLPLPVAEGETAIPDGYDTVVTLPLRDEAATDLTTRLLAGVDDTLLLTLPGLAEVTLDTPDGVRTLTRRQDGPYTVVDEAMDGAGGLSRVTRWHVLTDSGLAGPELLADRPIEERERPAWSVTWAVPVGADGAPAPLPNTPVVHAPTPTDEPLGLPALLIASFPLEPTRRQVAPGPLTDFLLTKAADAYAQLLGQWRPVSVSTLSLVPGPLGQGRLDTTLRELLLARLPQVAFLPAATPATAATSAATDAALRAARELLDGPEPAAGPVTETPGKPDDSPALRPVEAELVEDAGAATLAVLAELFPALLPAGLEYRVEPRVLGVARVPLGELIDRLAGAERPASWWYRLYASLAGVSPDLIAGLPVPLADGRTTVGPRHVLLPLPDAGVPAGVDPAQLSRLGLKVAHPEAAHPLLETLGAGRATAHAVLDTPQVRTAVAASLDDDLWDEDALTPEELAELVLALVREAGLEPGAEPWLAALALTDEDGELAPAGDLVLPGSPFESVIRLGELAACADSLVESWGAQPLTAVGVQAVFALVQATEVLLDPDELDPDSGPEHAGPGGTDELSRLDALDAAEVWCEDVLDALPSSPLPPVATEVLAVRDLELVDDSRWPQALAMLSERPYRDALTTPVTVRMPDGETRTARPYTAWWLRGAPVLDGRRPAGLRAAAADPLLAGLYEAVDTAEADDAVLRALGVRTTAAALLAEPGGAAELLDRLADPALPVTVSQLHGLYTLLAALDPAAVTLPDELRAVRDGEPLVVYAAEAVVADAPDLLPLAASRPLLPVPPRLASALSAVLDVPPLSTLVTAEPPSEGRSREVPEVVAALLGDQAPAGYTEHDELRVDGVDLDWRRTPDGTLHIATVEGLAAGLAWSAGQWPRRFELAALLEDPSRAGELATARWFD